jgi:hypothetical protein
VFGWDAMCRQSTDLNVFERFHKIKSVDKTARLEEEGADRLRARAENASGVEVAKGADMKRKIAVLVLGASFGLGLVASPALADQPPGQLGYEGQPGNQGGASGQPGPAPGLLGYEGQPGNQGG